MKNPWSVMVAMLLVAGTLAAQTPPSAEPPVSAPATANTASSARLAITGLIEDASGTLIGGDGQSGSYPPSHVGLGNKLGVLLNQEPPFTADKYVLFLNGSELKRVSASKTSYSVGGRAPTAALVFTLERNDDNAAVWNGILGAPKAGHIPITVSLGERASEGANQGTIVAARPGNATFLFRVFSTARLLLAIGAIALVVVLVWGHARSRSTLRDSYLPQLAPSRQTYSLARWQMAFWFTLVFSVFVFLFLLLGDINTITTQALSLMGISGLTAICAGAVDAEKYSPADAANRGLCALGLNSYEDVIRVRREIDERQTELGTTVDVQRRQQLTIEISDRNSVLRTYDDRTRLFTSQGWFTDITTDLNGTALHRLQVFCWTLTLGSIFVYLAYRNLCMPEFNGTLLALMGISSAGYVGFKFQEVNN